MKRIDFSISPDSKSSRQSRFRYSRLSAGLVFLCLLVISSLVVSLGNPSVQVQSATPGVGTWSEQTDYGASSGNTGTGGIPILGQSCVVYSGYIYCVGGQSRSGTMPVLSKVFSAPISSSGLGGWTETTDYGATSGSSGTGGLPVEYPSCVQSAGYIYCIGGLIANSPTSKVFYAQLSSGSVGAWTETTDYGAVSGNSGAAGMPSYQLSCATPTGSDYVYCVGGGGSQPTSKVFYAILATGNGIPRGWVEATDYGATFGTSGTGGIPTSGQACIIDKAIIFCVGGTTKCFSCTSATASTSAVYYASVEFSSGLSGWFEITDYGASSGNHATGGVPISQTACDELNDTIVCADGLTTGSVTTSDVFYGNLSVSGVTWYQGTAYGDAPVPGDALSLILEGGFLIGVGGGGSDIFEAPVNPLPPHFYTSSTTTTSSSSSSSSSTSSSSSSSSSTSSSSSAPLSTSSSTTSTLTSTSTKLPSVTLGWCAENFNESVTGFYCEALVWSGVKGGPTLTGTVTFTSNNGQFPGGNPCGLVPTSPGAAKCLVYYLPLSTSPATVTASYSGDSNYDPNGNTFGFSTSTKTVSGGGASADQQSSTGVSVSIMGSTSPDGTSITITSSKLGTTQPPNTGTLSIGNGRFYDISVAGTSSGTANICITGNISSSTQMQYYSNKTSTWNGVNVTSLALSSPAGSLNGKICGSVSVSSLTGTLFVVWQPAATRTTTTSNIVTASSGSQPNYILYVGAALVIVIIAIGAFFVFRRKT